MSTSQNSGGPEAVPAARSRPARKSGDKGGSSRTKKAQADRRKAAAALRPPQATLRYHRIPPDKVRIMARNVVGLPVGLAMDTLFLSPLKAAGLLLKLIKGAVSSATGEKNIDKNEVMYVRRIQVDRGPMLKRYHPCAHGRAKAILKRTSHVTVELSLFPDNK